MNWKSPGNDCSDVELVQRVRAGDKKAFDELYLRYHERLWRYAYRYVRVGDVADEIVQDVFLAVWERGGDWEVRDGVDKYLFTAVRNGGMRYLKREMFLPRGGVDEDVVDDTERMAESLEINELNAALAHAIQQMPEARRRVVQLRFGREMSYADIAEVLGISVEAATIQVARARETLKKVREKFGV